MLSLDDIGLVVLKKKVFTMTTSLSFPSGEEYQYGY